MNAGKVSDLPPEERYSLDRLIPMIQQAGIEFPRIEQDLIAGLKHHAEFSQVAEKVKHTLNEGEGHYILLLTWPEIQALIDLTDALPAEEANEDGTVNYNNVCSKLSEQLKWQAEGPK